MDINDVCSHFNIGESFAQSLADITPITFIKMLSMLHWDTKIKTSNNLALMYYIDEYGDFTEQKTDYDKIAMAMFNSMDNHMKRELILYLGWNDENES